MKNITAKTILIFCIYKLWRIFRFCLLVLVDATTAPKKKRQLTMTEIAYGEKSLFYSSHETE